MLLKLWSAARHRAAEVWLQGRGLMPEILMLSRIICSIGLCEYGTAFLLALSLKILIGNILPGASVRSKPIMQLAYPPISKRNINSPYFGKL